MCVPQRKGSTPGKRFEQALKQIGRLPSNKAEDIRHHTPKPIKTTDI
jgi:hypothetical protein